MRHEIFEFIKTQIDKILLIGIIGHFSLLMVYFMWRFPNLEGATLQWLEKSIDIAEGALIGAVTTALAIRREPAPGTVTATSTKEVVVTPEDKPKEPKP